MNMFDIVLIGFALVVLLWGFERYRTRFNRLDLVIFGVITLGLLSLALFPTLFDYVGSSLNIQQRPFAVSLLANVFLVLLVLYFIGIVRTIDEDVSELVRSVSVDETRAADGGAESIFVIIPAYNEGKTIQDVVKSLPKTLCGYTVQPLVVSDGSADDTAQRAQYNGAMVVEHPINQGQGGALKTGFKVAMDHDAAIVVTMDGDGQHPAEELEALVSPVVEDEADFVVGSRYRGEDQSGNGMIRKSGISFFTGLINVLTKSDLTDCTNGFRAIRGSDLERLMLTEERFNAPELLIEARKKGLRVQELPVRIEEREAGETKKPQLMYAIGLARTIFVTWIR